MCGVLLPQVLGLQSSGDQVENALMQFDSSREKEHLAGSAAMTEQGKLLFY